MRIIIFLFFIIINTISAKEWTIMVYINGDNNLDEYAFMDINELEIVGSSDNINIVVQYDRFASNSQANWATSKRFYITKDNDVNTINSIELMDLGEIDSGNYHSVVNFVTWAKNTYPSNNYALIMWDHGSGWQKKSINKSFQKSISSDDTSGSHISVANGDFEAMLSSIKVVLGKKLDFLGLDACLMAMWEVAYSAENYVSYIAFSEETENGTGWEYYTLLNQFIISNKTPRDLCISVVNSSLDSVGATLSCLDLSFIPSLTEKINNFATNFKDNNSIDFEILTAYSNTLNMETEEYYKDLGMFFNNLSLLVTDNIKNQWISPILEQYNNTVVISKGKNTDIANYSNATGLTIFMSMGSDFYDGEQELYLNSAWSNNTSWDEFITKEFHFNEDNYEPDNTISEAYFNEDKINTDHSIHSMTDVDFTKLDLKQNNSYIFETICNDYDTYMELLDENGTIINEDDDGGSNRCSKINYFSNKEQIVYLKVYTYDHESIAIYSLNISETQRNDDFPNTILLTKDLLLNNTTANIDYSGDIDFWYLDVNNNTEYTIETIKDSLNDTILNVYDSNGNLIDANDDIDTANKNYMSKLTLKPLKQERVYISIEAYDDKTGSYKVNLTTKNTCVKTNNGIEICDGIDNNCNGAIDENITLINSDKTKGVCKNSKKICKGTIGWVEPDYTTIKNYEPIEESCDGLDNNCDGKVDNGLVAPLNINQKGVCKGSKMRCNHENGWQENYHKIKNYSPVDDKNDNLDNNCDGQIDEDYKQPKNCSFGSSNDKNIFIFFILIILLLISKKVQLDKM